MNPDSSFIISYSSFVSFGFDDARHLELSRSMFGRILQNGIESQSGAHFIAAQDVDDRHNVACRLDIFSIERGQLLEMFENLRQFGGGALAFGGRKIQARQEGDVVDF